MAGIIANVREWLCDDRGVTAAEYMIMLALIIAVLIVTISAVGGTALSIFENDTERITNALSGS